MIRMIGQVEYKISRSCGIFHLLALLVSYYQQLIPFMNRFELPNCRCQCFPPEQNFLFMKILEKCALLL